MSDEKPKCSCSGCPGDDGDLYACINGDEYGPCDSENCGGVCELLGKCQCPLHVSPTHDSGYGGTYSE